MLKQKSNIANPKTNTTIKSVTAEQLKKALAKKLASNHMDKNSSTNSTSNSPKIDAMVNSAITASKKTEGKGISNRKYTKKS